MRKKKYTTEARRINGMKGYQKRVAEQGIENIKKIGREAAARRKTFSGGCTDKAFASAIGKKGGSLSRRSRKIKPDENLTDDEWMKLMKLANTAIGKIRLDGKADAVDQHKLRLDLQNAYEKKDWVSAFTTITPNPDYSYQVFCEIEAGIMFYQQIVGAEKALSDEQKEEYRVLRNLKTAYKVALETTTNKGE